MDYDKDSEIWKNFKDGHHAAFTIIYNKHIDMLYAYGSKLCSNQSLVKDCIQDVFIKLFEKRDKIRDYNAIKYYLFKSLKHALIDAIVREKKHESVLEKIEFKIEYSAEKYWIDNETDDSKRRKINEALNKLTNKQKEIIYLRFNQGLKFSEIADILNINSNTAKKQTYRILEKLRTILDEDNKYNSKSNFDFFYMFCF